MKQKLLLSTLFAVLLLAACTPAAKPVPAALTPTSAPVQPTMAATAAPLPTYTPELTAQPSPVPIDQVNLSVNLPAEVADGSDTAVMPASTEFHPHPEYLALTLNGYAISNTYDQPRIDVFPMDEFTQASPSSAKTAFDLGVMLSSRQAQSGDHLPFLSVSIEAQTFTAQPKFLSFANGSGIRYLTQYTQGIYPVMNSRMIYTFQGLTSDGKYYISAVLPEGADFLPDDFDWNNPNAGLPEGGIPFPGQVSDNLPSEVKVYKEALQIKIDQTPDGDFSIPLSSLDAMIESLEVREP